jgi:hypothetical protein
VIYSRLSAPASLGTIWEFVAFATRKHSFIGRFDLMRPVTTVRSRR